MQKKRVLLFSARVKDFNLQQIDVSLLPLFDVNDSKDIQVGTTFYLSGRFEESHVGLQTTYTSQSMHAFITSSIMNLFHRALGEISNNTMDMVVKRFHDSNLLNTEFKKTCKEVMRKRKRDIRDV